MSTRSFDEPSLENLVCFVFAVLLVGSGGVTAPEARADGLPVLRGWRLAETQGFHPSPRDSGSVFAIPGADTFGVFGGVSEAIDISGATQPTANTYFNDIFLFHGPTRTWTRRSTGAGPAPRAFTCAVYHEVTNSVFVFGGADFAADFSAFTFFDDLWSFDLATDTWTEIEPPGPGPSARGAFGCDLIGDAIFVFSGNGPNFSTDNELWRYDINAGSWTLLQADDPDDDSRPSARTQMTFARIPGQDELLLAGAPGASFSSRMAMPRATRPSRTPVRRRCSVLFQPRRRTILSSTTLGMKGGPSSIFSSGRCRPRGVP